MKILIKTSLATYQKFTNPDFRVKYIDDIWYHQLKQTFEELGHTVAFIGEKEVLPNIISTYDGWDILLFHEIPSFRDSLGYSIHLLKSFKGKKIYYSPSYLGKWNQEVISLFDYILVADSPSNLLSWRETYPNKKILPITWHSPRFEDMDRDLINPYSDDKFHITYFGLAIPSYLAFLNQLAKDGEQVYFGGLLKLPGVKHQNSWEITKPILDEVSPNLHFVFNGGFTYGQQFPWIRYADLGLIFSTYKGNTEIKHKMVEYLCCGTRVLMNESIPNAYHAIALDGGQIFPYDDYKTLYHLVQHEKENKYNKEILQSKARKVFDMKKVCRDIVASVKD